MKFYICSDIQGSDFDCVTTLSEAKQIVKAAGGGSVMMVDTPITADTIRRLLGQLGGFAVSSKLYEILYEIEA